MAFSPPAVAISLVVIALLNFDQLPFQPVTAIEVPFTELAEAYTAAYDRLTAKASTPQCKHKIMDTFQKYWEPFFQEDAMPFEREGFTSQCPIPSQDFLPPFRYEEEPLRELPISASSSNLDRREVKRIDHEKLAILYVMLVHQDAEFVTEIIKSLNEPMHTFVIHVDTKSPRTFKYLSKFYCKTKRLNHSSPRSTNFSNNVYVMDDNRVETNWGSFSIVEATLNTLRYGVSRGRSFHYVIDISGTTHPIKSNDFIRRFLSRDANAIYNGHGSAAVVPMPELLHSYVECDGFVHRIARLTRPRGIAVYVGSQWFAMPRHVAEWLLTDPLPVQYMQYARHVVVADEQYFATMLLNSPYCEDMLNRDVNYLIFTDFLAERGNVHKCLHPDPLRCGRSPTTLTISMHPTVEMSHALFARKFDPNNPESMALLEVVKDSIKKQEYRAHGEDDNTPDTMGSFLDVNNRSEKFVAGVEGMSEFTDDVGYQSFAKGGGETFMIAVIEKDGNNKNSHYDDIFYHIQHNNSAIVDQLLSVSSCLAFPDEVGEALEVLGCNRLDARQMFTKSKCVLVNTTKFPEFIGLHQFTSPTSDVTMDGTHFRANSETSAESVLQEYCNLRSTITGISIPGIMHEEDYLCVDIAGMSPVPDRDLVAYPCLGSWNQYFQLSFNAGTIASTIPKVVSDVTGMGDFPSTLCVEGKYVNNVEDDNNDDIKGQVFIEMKSNVCQLHSGENDTRKNSEEVEDEDNYPTQIGTQQFKFVILS